MTMTFLLAIALLFGMVYALENSLQSPGPEVRQHGLLRWVSTENWPAKVGAILIIIGVGALIRYAMIHLDLPDPLKLTGGILLAAAAGAAAWLCRQDPARRPLHYALTGAAFGIAYLCAYASFGLFGYLNDLPGVALLLTVAIVAAVYAATSRSVSIAVLSMVGAYAAPAFAVTPKGPLVVLGYYALVSALAFALVMARAWRPLIHLSFLFTLGGALFFGWTQAYYQPEHFEVMRPLLLVLVAIHVAMPLAEQRATRQPWLVRLDTAYLFLLPATAAVLMWSISPRLDPDAALGFALLGGIWLVAAGFAWRIRREAVASHALIGSLLILWGLLIHFQMLSWPLIGLVAGTGYIVAAERFGLPGASRTLAGVAVFFCYALFLHDGERFPEGGVPFLNRALAENAVVAAALVTGGLALKGRGGLLGVALLLAGALWGSLVLVNELIRVHIPHLPQIVHGLVVLTTLVLTFTLPAGTARERTLIVAMVALVLGSLWAADADSLPLGLALAAGTVAALLVIFRGRVVSQGAARIEFPFEAVALAVVAVVWAAALNGPLGAPEAHFVFAAFAATMLTMVLMARVHDWGQAQFDGILRGAFVIAALVLLYALVLHIERGPWPVIAELLGLAFMGVAAWSMPDRERSRTPMVAVAVLAGLILQAQILRLFGPPGVLNVFDVLRVAWPAVTSLLWALMGATLALTGQRMGSRPLWSVGFGLMAVSAVKLIFFDFGSLGELENILALIAAGVVFLVVAWKVPLPPKRVEATKEAVDDGSDDVSPEPTKHPAGDEAGKTGQRAPLPAQARTLEPGAVVEEAPVRDAGLDMPWKVNTGEPFDSTFGYLGGAKSNDGRSILGKGAAAIMLVVAIVVIIAVLREHRATRKAHAPTGSSAPALPAPAPPPPPYEAYAPAPAPAHAPAPAAPSARPRTPREQGSTAPPSPEYARSAYPAPKAIKPCDEFLAKLPANGYALLAGGAYSGAATSRSIDDSGHAATRFDVRVSEPSWPVVLALGAYEPSLWRVTASPGTRIAAILLTGYHHQILESAPANVPVLVSTQYNKSPCGYFTDEPQGFVMRFFKRPANARYVATNGVMQMGTGISFAPAGFADAPADTADRLAGEAGIEQLLREGKLRRARQQDIDAAKGHPDAKTDRLDLYQRIGKVYVVNSEFEIPPKLHGAHSVVFIVPRGAPYPTGNRGHCTIIDMGSL